MLEIKMRNSEFGMRNCILVTAFQPFGGDEINPTELVLNALPGDIGGYGIKKLLLPVEFGRAAELACAEFDRVRPKAVVMLGQAGGRSAITPEARAVNLMNAGIPDNAGNKPEGVPVSEGCPDELFSTLPLESIVHAVNMLGIPAEISQDAGAYVCNSLLYGMLAHNGGKVPTGFIHVPFIREQTEGTAGRENTPYLELEDIINGITASVYAVIGAAE